MMGEDIIINYEPDSYSTSAANGMASLLMGKGNIEAATLADGSTNLTFKLNLPGVIVSVISFKKIIFWKPNYYSMRRNHLISNPGWIVISKP